MNFVVSGLFGDGVVVVVIVGLWWVERLGIVGFEIVGICVEFYFDSESVIGWDIGGLGFCIMLIVVVFDMIDVNIDVDVWGLLVEYELVLDDVGVWIVYFGGLKVLEVFECGLYFEYVEFDVSWCLFDVVGNFLLLLVFYVLLDMFE